MTKTLRRRRGGIALLLAIGLAACGGSGGEPGGNDPGTDDGDGAPLPASLERVFTGLAFARPTDIQAQPAADGTRRLFVARKSGIIEVFEPRADTPRARTYLDVSGLAGFNTDGEQGLLGLAFDPDYPSNGHLYVHLVKSDPRRVVIVRFTDDRDGTLPVDPATATDVLVADTFDELDRTNHVAGGLAFGPADGFLYLTMGDGGGGFDPQGAAQDRTNLRGSILRIDVDGTGEPGGARNYDIPQDNPYVGNDRGFREEIYAFGLRNPFRISVEATDDGQRVWVGDVGQGEREEVDIITPGGNYGWDCREGTREVGDANDSPPCDSLGDEDFVAPVIEYGRDAGRSITGGYVYRGARLAGELSGRYVYGDFGSGRIWALDPATGANDLLLDSDLRIVTFGEGSDGTLYFADFDGGGLYRLAP